jgi:hypothetical protein
MTIEQMDKVLMNNVPAKEGRDEIRAALRAGQAMRSRFTVKHDREGDCDVATKVDFVGLGEAGAAWDATTNNDKGE